MTCVSGLRPEVWVVAATPPVSVRPALVDRHEAAGGVGSHGEVRSRDRAVIASPDE